MALKRLLLGICGVVVILANTAFPQVIQPTEANQDGVVVTDALGRFFTANDSGVGVFLFEELQATSQKLGFVSPIVKDVELVGNPDGSILGGYAADIFGGQFPLTLRSPGLSVTDPVTLISSPSQVGANSKQFSTPPFFGFDVIEDLEVVPDWREATHGYKGYYLLDADGIVHTLGETNLPKYVYYQDPASTDIANATIVSTLYPETIDASGSNIVPEDLLRSGPLTIPMNRLFFNQSVESVTPVFTYFGAGSDIARDLEISTEFVMMTLPSKAVTGVVESRTIARGNGYYILDGFGAVHSSRLPLDFDVNNDGNINVSDMYLDVNGDGVIDRDDMNADVPFVDKVNAEFGAPINNLVIAPLWASVDLEDLPFFGVDVAVDIEITPSGRGFYLLDSFGGIFAIGDASLTFPPKGFDENGAPIPSTSTTPFFGFPIARDLALVPNKANASIGLKENSTSTGFLVIDGFGTVHKAGLANDYSVSSKGNNGKRISSFSDTFRAVEISPLWLPAQPDIAGFEAGKISGHPFNNFVVGSQNIDRGVAGRFRNVTGAFSDVKTTFVPVTNAQ